MKESEFIELLNLYLDHEISAADAARLETEVQNHPARRKVYQQYCRMQKACKVLTADFQAVGADVAAAEKKIIAFDPAAADARRKRANGFYTVGAFAAAAACVAIIFVGRSRERAESASQVQGAGIAQVAPATTTAANAGVAQVAASSASPRALGRPQSTLVADSLLLSGTNQAELVVAGTAKEANDQLDWIRTVQLAPLQQQLQAQLLRFDLPPATLRPEARSIRANRAPTETAVEMTAFEFRK